MNRDFVKYSLISVPVIAVMATIQHMVVMDIPFTPLFYVVPVFAALGFSYMGAKIKELIKNNEAQKWETKIAQIQRMSTLGLFSSSIAHDLNNVLHGINLGLEAKRKGVSGENTDEHIARSLKRGEELVEQILAFAKGAESERRLVNLEVLLEEIEILANTFAARKINITMNRDKEQKLCTLGNQSQLYQVLLNLVVNAIQAVSDVVEPEIHIKAGSSEGDAIVCVEDNGSGLSAAAAARLFEPFSTTGKENGTGIGLYISKQIISSHGGKISYHPTQNGGTCFEVRLPLAEPDTSAAV